MLKETELWGFGYSGSFSLQELHGDIALMPLNEAAEKGKAISSKHHILIVFIATICQIYMLGFYRKVCTKICHSPH